MLFSVYRPELKVYDYYRTPPEENDARNPPSDDVAGRQVRSGSDGAQLGVSSERAGYRLPSNARKVGQGVAPCGMIVTRHPSGGGLGSSITDDPTSKWVFIGGLGIFLYSIWDKFKDRR